MEKNAQKVCISGYYGFDNFGDEAVLKILVQNLKSFKNPPSITVFSVSPQKTAEQFGVKCSDTFNLKSLIPEILNSSCLISGGGSLLQDSSSALSLLYYLFVIALAEAAGRKVFIFAQGIGPVKNRLLKKIMFFILKHADYITVRDENSFNLLKSCGINRISKCSDPVWNIDIKKNINQNRLGIQLRKCSFITDDFIKKLAQNINRYYSDKEICILSFQNSYDMEVCKRLKSELFQINPKIKSQVIPNTSIEKTVSDTASCGALIAMRYHACLAAVKAGIKLLPVNYDIKVKALADEFNLSCINSIDDMDSTFKDFNECSINYDMKKIFSKKFDFSVLEKFLDCGCKK